MTRSSLRNLVTAAALVLMISLTGCILVFTVVGSDVYDVYSTGIDNDPIKVDVTVKGLWPVWPDTLTASITGTVNPVGEPADAGNPVDVNLANTIEAELYSELWNGGDNEYESVTAEGVLSDDVFSVEVVMAIPGLKDLAAQGGATASLAFNDVSLEDLLQPPSYSELVADLQQACSSIPTGNAVRTMLSGELTKGTKLIGDLEITFILNGSQILP